MKDTVNWDEINEKLPVRNTKEDATARKKIFNNFDGNGNGYLSLAECDKGVRDVLKLDEVFASKKALNAAFAAAKNKYQNKSKYGGDYVELNEFKFFLIYLRQNYEYWVMFKTIDDSFDDKVQLTEFKQAVPEMEKWGVKISDPETTFNEVSKGDSAILFSEFLEWAIKQSLDLENDEDIQVD